MTDGARAESDTQSAPSESGDARHLHRVKQRLTGLLAALAVLCSGAAQARPAAPPIEIRVVVITTWEAFAGGRDIYGEQHAWRTQWPMRTELPFPAGARPLLYDPKRRVL